MVRFFKYRFVGVWSRQVRSFDGHRRFTEYPEYPKYPEPAYLEPAAL